MTSRSYHNLTARYNVYFNAKEALKAGEKNIETAHKDNYIDILPMFYYSDKNACNSASSQMQRAIDKSTKLIKEHSITAKPKHKNMELTPEQKQFYAKRNFCNWVDNAYFVMGKAFLMKHDYFAANKNFETVANEYKYTELRIPGRIWQARTKIEENLPEDAIEILQKIEEEPQYPENYRQEINAVYACAYIKSGNYKEAIVRLEQTIELTKKKSTRLRYTYILSQLYQATNDNAKAQDILTKLLKKGLPYEMAFNAKINLATSFQNGSTEDIKRMLNKLLKDSKNKEFNDQIYYALANIAFHEGDIDKALEMYKRSLSANVSNTYQKSMSFLAIGNIYYDKKEYLKAQPYFDSCATIIDESTRGYQSIITKSKNLNELAENYTIVTTQDSLQRLAKMPESQRNEIIDKTIKSVIDKEEADQREQNEAARLSMMNQTFTLSSEQNSSKFYFYNTSAVSLGKVEFVKQWGTRKLEDDWRRKNKSANSATEETENTSASDTAMVNRKQKLSNKSREFYLIDIPNNDSLLKISENKIETALFNVGTVFMNKLEDYPQAIETFEKFVSRFPESEFVVTAYYNLYVMNQELSYQSKAEQYKNIIISKYPDSKYAQAINNPNFLRDIKARESKIESIFKHAYKAYFTEKFNEAIDAVAEAEKSYPDCESMSKFQFIKSMSKGRMATASVMQEELKAFVAKYPEGEPTELAKKIISFIDEQKQNGANTNVPLAKMMKDSTSSLLNPATTAERQKQEEKPLYSYQEAVPHYFVIAADAQNIKISRLKFNAINYNLEYFSNFPFEVTEKTLGKRYNIIMIKPFTDGKQALSYYDLASVTDDLYESIDKSKTEQFIISEQNLEILQKEFQLDKYMEFFYQNYIK